MKPSNYLLLFVTVLMLGATIFWLTQGDPISPATPQSSLNDECSFEGSQVWRGSQTGISCTMVTVPADYTDPRQASIQLPVVILHSTSATPAPDPLVINHGGPGDSLVDTMYPFFVNTSFGDALRRQRDIILIETRGTRYTSTPLTCEALYAVTFEVQAISADSGEAFKQCVEQWAADEIDLANYQSLASANDIITVLDHFEYQTFNYYGASYGTMLGQHLLRDHSTRLRSVILDGVAPLAINHYTEVGQSFYGALRQVFDTCAQDNNCQALYPDLETTFFTILDELNTNPYKLTLEHPLTGESVTLPVDGYTLAAFFFPLLHNAETISMIPALITGFADPNLRGPFLDNLLPEIFAGADVYIDEYNGLFYGAHCAERSGISITNANLVDLPAILHPLVHDAIETFTTLCTAGAIERFPAQINTPVESDIPTLVLSGQFDPVTAAPWGAVVAETLTHSYEYVLAGVGHGTILSPCGQQLISDFLAEPRTAPVDDCVQSSGIEFIALEALLDQ